MLIGIIAIVVSVLMGTIAIIVSCISYIKGKNFQMGITEQLFQEQRQQRNEPVNPAHLGIGKDGKPCIVFELERTDGIKGNDNCEVDKKEN